MPVQHQGLIAQRGTLFSSPKTLLLISILTAVTGTSLTLILGNNTVSLFSLFSLRRPWIYQSAPSRALSTPAGTRAAGTGAEMKAKTPVYFLSHGGVCLLPFLLAT